MSTTHDIEFGTAPGEAAVPEARLDRIRKLLAKAKPHANADMVLSRSQDGWTAGTPTPPPPPCGSPSETAGPPAMEADTKAPPEAPPEVSGEGRGGEGAFAGREPGLAHAARRP